MKSFFARVPFNWAHENKGGDDWSPSNVIGHLIHEEKIDSIPRFIIILKNDPSKNKTIVLTI